MQCYQQGSPLQNGIQLNDSRIANSIYKVNPFSLYVQDKRQEVIQNNPTLSRVEITKLLYELWVKEPSKVKRIYRQKAQKDNDDSVDSSDSTEDSVDSLEKNIQETIKSAAADSSSNEVIKKVAGPLSTLIKREAEMLAKIKLANQNSDNLGKNQEVIQIPYQQWAEMTQMSYIRNAKFEELLKLNEKILKKFQKIMSLKNEVGNCHSEDEEN